MNLNFMIVRRDEESGRCGSGGVLSPSRRPKRIGLSASVALLVGVEEVGTRVVAGAMTVIRGDHGVGSHSKPDRSPRAHVELIERGVFVTLTGQVRRIDRAPLQRVKATRYFFSAACI